MVTAGSPRAFPLPGVDGENLPPARNGPLLTRAGAGLPAHNDASSFVIPSPRNFSFQIFRESGSGTASLAYKRAGDGHIDEIEKSQTLRVCGSEIVRLNWCVNTLSQPWIGWSAPGPLLLSEIGTGTRVTEL